MYDTLVEFVKDGNIAQTSPQTGDILIPVLIFCAFAIAAILIFIIFKKNNIFSNYSRTNLGCHINSKINIFSSTKSIILVGLIALFIVIFTFATIAYALPNINSIEKPDKITALVNDDGSINVDNINITNNNEVAVIFSSLSISANDVDVNSLYWKIQSGEQIVYNGASNQKYEITPNITINTSDKITLNFQISVDMSNVEQLIGKTYKMTFGFSAVEPKTPTLNLNKEILALDESQTNSIDFSYDGDGVVDVKTENNNIVDCWIENNKVFVKAKSSGPSSITIFTKNSVIYKDIEIKIAVYVTKNYTGSAFYPFSGAGAELDKMSGLKFAWNPYKFFTEDNTIYNSEFSRFLAAISNDVYTTSKIELDGVEHWDKTDCISLYKLLGFTDIEDITLTRDEYTYDKDDLSSFIIAHLKVETCGKTRELVLVNLRGTCLTDGSDWVSDFEIGAEGGIFDPKEHPEWLNHNNHKGLDVAYRRVLERIYNYIDKYISIDSEITTVETGHSRGAGIASLIGYDIEKQRKFKNFTYAFAPPRVTTDTDIVALTVFNIVNDDDAVGKVPSKNWGFNTIGQLKHINMSESEECKNRWLESIGKEYVKADGETLDKLIVQIAQNRQDLYTSHEELPYAINEQFDSYIEANEYLSYIKSLLQPYDLSEYLIYHEITEVGGKYNVIADITPRFLMQVLAKTLYYYRIKGIEYAVEMVLDVLKSGVNFPDSYISIIWQLVSNVGGMTTAHCPVACYIMADLDTWN